MPVQQSLALCTEATQLTIGYFSPDLLLEEFKAVCRDVNESCSFLYLPHCFELHYKIGTKVKELIQAPQNAWAPRLLTQGLQRLYTAWRNLLLELQKGKCSVPLSTFTQICEIHCWKVLSYRKQCRLLVTCTGPDCRLKAPPFVISEVILHTWGENLIVPLLVPGLWLGCLTVKPSLPFYLANIHNDPRSLSTQQPFCCSAEMMKVTQILGPCVKWKPNTHFW